MALKPLQPPGQGPIRVDVQAALHSPLGVPHPVGAAHQRAAVAANQPIHGAMSGAALHSLTAHSQAPIAPGHVLAGTNPNDVEALDLPEDALEAVLVGDDDPIENAARQSARTYAVTETLDDGEAEEVIEIFVDGKMTREDENVIGLPGDTEDVDDPDTDHGPFTQFDLALSRFRADLVLIERSRQHDNDAQQKMFALLKNDLDNLRTTPSNKLHEHIRLLYEKAVAIVDHLNKVAKVKPHADILAILDWIAWAKGRITANPRVNLGPLPSLPQQLVF